MFKAIQRDINDVNKRDSLKINNIFITLGSYLMLPDSPIQRQLYDQSHSGPIYKMLHQMLIDNNDLIH